MKANWRKWSVNTLPTISNKSDRQTRLYSAAGRLHFWWVWAGIIILAWLFASLIHAGFSAFTWRKFVMFDYGVYTNMIWNSGHGDGFRCLVDSSYLVNHLSFSLALLGPLYRVWDHPFLLWVIQWLFLVGGVLFLARAAWRLNVPGGLTVAILIFFAGYHYTQQALLSEVHGVCFYFILIPWFYYFLKFQRQWLWLPFLLILGVREDAAVVILPALLYFAVRERWRGGYVYAALALGYMVLAMTTLYPLLTGLTLMARRHADLGSNPLAHLLNPETLATRAAAIGWVYLPILPFLLKRGWLPLLVFPSLSLLQAMGGGTTRQHSLELHYAAPVMACLVIAMLETTSHAGGARHDPHGRLAHPWRVALTIIFLLVITGSSYRARGFLPGGLQRQAGKGCYIQPHDAGWLALEAARHIPREGLLLCPSRLAGFCANRKDIIDWPNYDPARHSVDLVFTEFKLIDGKMNVRPWLEDGSFGLIYFDGTFLILQRGANPTPNEILKQAWQRAQTGRLFARTSLPIVPGLANTTLPLTTAHWAGSPSGGPFPLHASAAVTLNPGEVEATFLFSARAPSDGGMTGWGELLVRRRQDGAMIAARPIDPIGGGPRNLRAQSVPFVLSKAAEVEAVVICDRAELWLLRVDFSARRESEGL